MFFKTKSRMTMSIRLLRNSRLGSSPIDKNLLIEIIRSPVAQIPAAVPIIARK